MKNSKRVVSVFILITLSLIALSTKAQRQNSRVSNRQVSDILQRLTQSTDQFRNGLKADAGQSRADRRPANNINTLERNFENATNQFNDRFRRRRASANDVRNVLQTASPINDFISSRRFDVPTQTDWASVRRNLEELASAYALNWQWQPLPTVSASGSNRLSDRELDVLIGRIENGGDQLRSSLTDSFDRTPYDRTRGEGNVNDAVREFKRSTDQLRDRFDAKQLMVGDVESVLGQATLIDTLMRNNQVTDRAQGDWSALRGDLTALARAYDVNPSWRNTPTAQTGSSGNGRLTGTFRLNVSRSDDPQGKAQRATQNLSDSERQRVYGQIIGRLESPEMLSIERRGATMTIASSLAPQATFEADGRERQEQLGNGRSSRVTATLRGEQLVVSSNGYREDDFNITFDGTANDRSLRVRRQIYSDGLTQPVVVDSFYDRTAGGAQWSVYNDPRPVLVNPVSNNGDFVVRDGESLVAVLSSDLTTKQAKPGDRFAMRVREPNQYEGAVIEGTVASVNQGGRLTGRAEMSLNFDTIRLPNGQTHRFSGILVGVRALDGDVVKVDNEGTAQGDNQTTQTVERAGIGTAIGAIIGAVAGGGKGAAIGAIIGAAGGAGSVYVQGKDDLELPTGTELTIRASAPKVG